MRCITASFLKEKMVVPSCLLMLMVGSLPCWALNMDHIAAGGSERTREARAAQSPPTVTSLRPPDRSGHGHGVGISVRSDSGGDTGPPVVASRSPYSTWHAKDTSGHLPRASAGGSNEPSAPVATATSGSRAPVVDASSATGRRSLPDPHVVEPATFGDAGAPGSRAPSPSSPWSRYDVARDDVGWARGGGHPARPVGDVREGEASVSEGAWDTQARRVPSSSEGRPDTFGHRISEDLSHLDTEYSPRKSNRRWSSQVPSIHFSSASSSVHGSYPQRPFEDQNSRWYNSRVASGSGNERSSTRFRNWDREERTSTSPRPSYVDYNAHEYPPRGSYNYPSRARDPMSRGSGDPYHNPASRGEPALLTIQQIKQMINITSHDEFFELLKKRGIGFSQLLEYMNRGANEDEVLQLLGHLRTTTTTTTESPEARLPQTRPEDEDGDDAFDSQADSSLYFGEGAHRASQGSSFRGGVPAGRDEMSDGEALASSSEERRRNRKDRKRKGRKNRRRKGKGGRKRLPDLIYTTDILPVDGGQDSTRATEAELNPEVDPNINLPTPTQQPDVVRSYTSTVSPVLLGPSPNQPPVLTNSPQRPDSPSTPPAFPEEIPEVTSIPIVPVESSGTQSRASLPTTMQVFPEPPVFVTAAPSVTTTDVAILLPTSGQVVDDTPTTTSSSSTPPSAPRDPFTDDETFPPGVRPSEVSIHSITVMKIPSGADGEETLPEVIAPASRRPKHRRPVVKAHFPPERNISRFTTTNLEEPEFEIGSQTNFVREKPKEEYQFPIKGLLIISGVLGAMAVFTLVILISYCIIKCSKPPAINNYRVTEQKPVAQ
ncbi:uncharacterized protein LOC122256955 isoform X2 [Penaeus japonicus]|uniref:uncharacterized protein LOC122256955 isoform X2 n=1 Tax=Penaeus japonicus TaxID=27405 RepID=UPI001C70EACC|nr:uncharacterized protein LOC122256955 isoform X2 [Penaeus japonicus]